MSRFDYRRGVVVTAVLAQLLGSDAVAQPAPNATQSIQVIVHSGRVVVRPRTGTERELRGSELVAIGDEISMDEGALAFLVTPGQQRQLKPGRTLITNAALGGDASPTGFFSALVALFVPSLRHGPATAHKGHPEAESSEVRALFPGVLPCRDQLSPKISVIADSPVHLAWSGPSGVYVVQLFRVGTPRPVWRSVEVRTNYVDPPASALTAGESYTWDVQHASGSTDFAVFSLANEGVRKRVSDERRTLEAACAGANVEPQACKLAIAGTYRRSGFVYDAGQWLRRIPTDSSRYSVAQTLIGLFQMDARDCGGS